MSGELLTPAEAADYLGVKTGTLAWWRSRTPDRLRFYKNGRVIRYRRSDLENFTKESVGQVLQHPTHTKHESEKR